MVVDLNNKKNYQKSAEKNQVNEKELDKDSEKVASNVEYPYDVKITDIWGTTSKEVTTFPVRRYIEGGNVYLFNEKKGFKEIMPEDTDDYKSQTLEGLNIDIKKIQDKIKKNNNTDNQKTLKKDLRILNNLKRSIELQGRGSYMRLNSEGRPYFEFDRRGNFKLPVFKNVDISTLYIPSETKIKTGSELLTENDDKNGDNNMSAKIVGVVLLIICLLGCCAGLFFTYKTSQVPDVCAANFDRTAIVLNGVVTKMDKTADSMGQVVDNMDNLTNKLVVKPDEVSTKPKVDVVD